VDVPVAITEVKDREFNLISGSFNDGVDAWQGEGIFDSDSVDLLVVEYGVETSILFLDVEDGSCVGGLRFSNKASIQLFLDVFVLELLFSS